MNNRINIDAITEFFKHEPLIRILFDDAEGMGDLQASHFIEMRLKDVKFQGRTEVIYPDSSKDKMITLFNLPHNIEDCYENNNILFMTVSQFNHFKKNNLIAPARVGLTGALFNIKPLLKNYEIYLLDNLPLTKELIHYKNSYIFTKTNPMELYSVDYEGASKKVVTYNDLWTPEFFSRFKTDPLVSLNKRLDTKNLEMCYDMLGKRQLLDILNIEAFVDLTFMLDGRYSGLYVEGQQDYNFPSLNTFIHPEISTLQQAKTFLYQTDQGKDLIAKKPGLLAYIEGLENEKFNDLSVYGWTVTDKYNIARRRDNTPGNILQIIAGARAAQLNNTNDNLKKPLIISVYYDYIEESKKILTALQTDDWGDFEVSGANAARATMKELGLTDPGVFQVASVTDSNTAELIHNLKEKQILLLAVGSLPHNVFSTCFNYVSKSKWPQVREGVGTFFELLLTGKPHFRCGQRDSLNVWELGYDDIADDNLKNTLREFYQDKFGFCNSMQTWQNNPKIYQVIESFIVSSQDINSPFSQYFVKLNQTASDINNDRLLIVLNKLVEVLSKTPSPMLQSRKLLQTSAGSLTNQSLLVNIVNNYLVCPAQELGKFFQPYVSDIISNIQQALQNPDIQQTVMSALMAKSMFQVVSNQTCALTDNPQHGLGLKV